MEREYFLRFSKTLALALEKEGFLKEQVLLRKLSQVIFMLIHELEEKGALTKQNEQN